MPIRMQTATSMSPASDSATNAFERLYRKKKACTAFFLFFGNRESSWSRSGTDKSGPACMEPEADRKCGSILSGDRKCFLRDMGGTRQPGCGALWREGKVLKPGTEQGVPGAENEGKCLQVSGKKKAGYLQNTKMCVNKPYEKHVKRKRKSSERTEEKHTENESKKSC